MIKKDLHFILKNGAAYNFKDNYLALIKELLSRKIKVTFLQEDFYTSESFFESIRILEENENFQFFLLKKPKSIIDHQRFLNILKKIESQDPKFLLLDTDFTIWDRYLINFSRNLEIKIGLLQINILKKEILVNKNKSNKFLVNKKALFLRIYFALKKNGFVKFFSLLFRIVFQTFMKSIKLNIFKIHHHFLLPFLLGQGFFLDNENDKYAFCSGRTDFVLCRSVGDKNVIEKIIGSTPKYIHIKMPKLNKKIKKIDSKKVLFIMSSIYSELTEKNILFCKEIVEFLKDKKEIKRVDLRLHPRTNSRLKWPNKLKGILEDTGLEINLQNRNASSLSEIAHDYLGFVCAFSSAARICQEQSESFVTCVLNISGRLNEESWMLGDLQDVCIIKAGEKLSDEMFVRGKNNLEAISLMEFLITACNV